MRRAYSGHGPEIEDFGAAVDAARSRYTKWLEDPEKSAWHGCKRIFAYALMIGGGLPAEEVHPYLLDCPWFADYSRHGFGIEPKDLVESLLSEMLRSGAAGWRDRRLTALPPHTAPSLGWLSGPYRLKDWPKASGRASQKRSEEADHNKMKRPRYEQRERFLALWLLLVVAREPLSFCEPSSGRGPSRSRRRRGRAPCPRRRGSCRVRRRRRGEWGCGP